jgi:pimeloyl-ACP methyl ester carboxylesterase
MFEIFKRKEVSSNYIYVNGFKVHYLKGGFNPFSRLIFLHGLGGSSKCYSDLVEMLSRHHEVYAIDFPSFGETQELDKPWKISDFADFIMSFIKTQNLGKVVLMGHSAGGLVAIEIASRKDASRMIKKLVLVDSAGLEKEKNDLEFMFRLAFLNPVNHYLELKKNLKLNQFFKILGNSWKTLKRNIVGNKVIFKSLYQNWSYTCEEKLKDIKISTTIIWAKEDELFPIKDAYFFNKSIKGSKLYLIDGYHNWTSFSPEKGKDVLRKI